MDIYIKPHTHSKNEFEETLDSMATVVIPLGQELEIDATPVCQTHKTPPLKLCGGNILTPEYSKANSLETFGDNSELDSTPLVQEFSTPTKYDG